MIPEKYKQIIQSLINKTEENKACWKKSSGADSYSLKYSEGMIEIDSWNISEEQISYVDLTLFNKAGDKIDYLQASSTEPIADYLLLKDLHGIVRRNFYKIDDALASLLKELSNKDDVIGDDEDFLF